MKKILWVSLLLAFFVPTAYGQTAYQFHTTVVPDSNWNSSAPRDLGTTSKYWRKFYSAGYAAPSSAFTTGKFLSFNGTQIYSTAVDTATGNLTGTTDQVNLSASGTGVLLARSIQLSLPQSIATTSSPSFAGLTLTGALAMGANTITSGLINGQTISSAANFTGTMAVGGGILSSAGTIRMNNSGGIHIRNAGNTGDIVLAGSNEIVDGNYVEMGTNSANIFSGFKWFIGSITPRMILTDAGLSTTGTLGVTGKTTIGTGTATYQLSIYSPSGTSTLGLSYSSATEQALQFINTNTNGKTYSIGDGIGVAAGTFGIYNVTNSTSVLSITGVGNMNVPGTLGVTGATTLQGNLTITKIDALLTINATNADAAIKLQNNGAGDWLFGTQVVSATQNFELYNYGTSSLVLSFNKTTNAATFASTISSGAHTINGTTTNTLTEASTWQSLSYSPRTTGWKAGTNGIGDFRYVYADEMHAKAFVADLEMVKLGSEIIANSASKIDSIDFVLPTAGNSGTLIVEELSSFTGQVFANSDTVLVRVFTRTAGNAITIANAWGRVTWLYRNASNNPPTQAYTFLRLAANGGSASGTVTKGTLVVDFGQGVGGYIESDNTSGSTASPVVRTVTFTSVSQLTADNQVNRAQMGNLGSSKFGFWAKDESGNTAFRADQDSVIFAGFRATSTKLFNTSGGGSSFVGIQSGTGSTKSFFAGATDNTGTNATFSVTAAGALTAKSGAIGGWLIASDSLYNGADAHITGGSDPDIWLTSATNSVSMIAAQSYSETSGQEVIVGTSTSTNANLTEVAIYANSLNINTTGSITYGIRSLARSKTSYGVYGSAHGNGITNSVAYGIFGTATNATTNWAGYFDVGNVNIVNGLLVGSGTVGAAGTITTTAPTGGTAAAWKLGTVASVSPTSPNRTIEIEIGGTTYYVAAKTTNN